MEAQDQNKTQPSGNGSHGVHVCNKCGWPFPNPHPSAKYRRAHKKVCGTIEGYKQLVLSAVDDEHHSDEDHKTPNLAVEGPNAVESASASKVVAEHGAVSTRSEDEEVFLDAIADYRESGSSDEGRVKIGNESAILVVKVAEKDLSTEQSFKECFDTDVVQSPKNTSDLNQMQPPHVQNLPQPEITCRDLGSNSSDNFSGMLTCDRPGSESGVPHIKSEKQTSISDESEKCTGENMINESGRKNDEVTLEMQPDNGVLPVDERTDQTLETTLGFERKAEINLDRLAGDESILLKHEYDGESAFSMPISEVVEEEAHQKGKEVVVSDSCLENVMAITSELAETRQECAGESASDMPISEPVKKEDHHEGDKEIVSDSSIENVMDVPRVHAETRQEYSGASASCMPISEAVGKEVPHMGDGEVSDSSLENVMAVMSECAETWQECAGESASSMPISEVVEKEACHKGDREMVSDHSLQNVMAVTSEHAKTGQEYGGESASSMPTSGPVEEKAHENGENEIFSGSQLENVIIVSGEHAETKSEVTVKSKKRKEITSDIENGGKTVQTEEERINILAPSTAANAVLSHAESVEYQTDIADTVWEKLDVAAQAELAKDGKDEVDDSAHVLEVPSDVPAIENAESMLEGFKDHKRMKFRQSVSTCSGGQVKGEEDEMKDLPKETASSSDEIKDLNPKEVSSVSWSTELSGESNLMTEVLTERKTTTQKNEGLNTTESQKGQETYALEEQHSPDICDSLQDVNCSEKEMKVSLDMNSAATMDFELDQFANVKVNDHDISQSRMHDVVASENHERAQEENYISNAIVPSDSATDLSRIEASDHVGGKTELHDADEIGSEELMVGQISADMNSSSKSISSNQEPQISMEGKNDEHVEVLTNSQNMNLNRVLDSQEEVDKHKSNKDLKLQGDKVDEAFSTTKSCEDEGSVETKTSVGTMKKESSNSPVEAYPPCSLPPADGSPDGKFVEDAHEIDDSFVKHLLDSSVTEFSVESGSQADSLEANPGSISVISNLSDIPAVTETGVLKSTVPQPSMEAEGANLQNQQDASWVHHMDKSEVFEPPSFMTLVELGTGNQKSATSKIQTPENPPQLDATSLRAGWFPSLTSVPNESPGRKKNEEIIAKVTNWNTNQEHTPLKNLLGKGSAQAKASSPNRRENQPLLAREALLDEPSTAEAAKEWNSPARYPADIKRERRKAKGRPYWAQFVCCSSVH